MMNEKLLLLKRVAASLAVFVAGAFVLHAQESFGGLPATFETSGEALRNEFAPNVLRYLPDFNPDDLRARNDWSGETLVTKPLIIGGVIPVDIDFAREAKRSELVDGRVIYRLRIDTKGSRGLNLYYKDFFIPKDGGTLYIYTPDREHVLGAYTFETHPERGAFATEPLPGSSLIMEYVCALGNEVMPTLQIEGLNYIFRPYKAVSDVHLKSDLMDDGSNPNCTVNVNCKDGDKWQTEKAGVVQMQMTFREGGQTYSSICTGNLVNNTNQDFTPYILSAAHCVGIGSSIDAGNDFNQFIFTFHYEKPGCSSASFALRETKSIVGCQVKAFLPIKGQSDGLLLQLSKQVPEAYRVYYNGWDRSATIPDSVVGIHHPKGDAKKISLNRGNIGSAKWITSEATGGVDDHLMFNYYNNSDTEGGSSGSSLFNPKHLVVGTLTGGQTRCMGSNYYGRLSSHWDKYKSTPDYAGGVKSHMDIFLDPKNNGSATKLEGTWRNGQRPLDPIKGLEIKGDGESKKITLTWKEVNKSKIPSHWTVKYRIYRNGVYLKGKDVTSGNTFSESFADAKADIIANGSIYYGVQARYMFGGDQIPDDGYNAGSAYLFGDAGIVTDGLYLSEVIRSMPVAVTAASSGGVDVAWKTPGNMQEISLFGYPADLDSKLTPRTLPRTVDFTKRPPKYGILAGAASKFHVDAFGENANVYIYAVSLIPTEKLKNNYRLLLRNGATRYQQAFDVPDDWEKGKWLTIKLDKPFKIETKHATWIGFTVPNKEDAPGLMYVKGASDDEMLHRDYLVTGDDGSNFNRITLYGSKYIKDGYAAIRVIASPTSTTYSEEAEHRIVARSKRPTPFPVIKGYNVSRDGKKINNELITLNFYTDKEGSTGAKYEVEVVYENGMYNSIEAMPNELPSVYPSHLAQDGLLHIAKADQVLKLTVYGIDGIVLKSFAHPSNTIDLAELPQGMYIVVLETTTGKITEQISR